jgi:hypothetical protein
MCGIALTRLAAEQVNETAGSDLYAPLIGGWSIQSVWYEDGVEKGRGQGEWYFEWILGGTAVQDVLFGVASKPDEYGTSLRAYDAAADMWHVTWMQPKSREFAALVGHSDGKGGIVHIGKDLRPDQDEHLRWTFPEIGASSFTWLGERSANGVDWNLVQRMDATRMDL